MELLEELQQRGLIADVTHRDELARLLAAGRVTLYAGYDPTSSTLHVGNLVPTILLKRFQLAGHRPIVVVGGATGMIGDPSGKSQERNLLDEPTLATNVAGLRAQLGRLLDFDDPEAGAIIVNNADWTRGISYLEFLRDVGKHLTVNYMMGKESVKSRLRRGTDTEDDERDDGDHGISYTEFSYMLLQAFDFVQLSKTHGCRLQVGGSDQFGNITAGCELSRKAGGPQLYGLTAPLLLDSSGAKMGKTATGERVDLDASRFSPYKFFQYWFNLGDDDAIAKLKVFSLKSLAEINDIVRAHDADRGQRIAQRELARAMTSWVHGAAELARVEAASRVMFGESIAGVTDQDLASLAGVVPTLLVRRADLEGGISIVDLVARAFDESKSATRRLVEGAGVAVNNVAVRSETLDELKRRLKELDKEKGAGAGAADEIESAKKELKRQIEDAKRELFDRKVSLADLATETTLVMSSGRRNRCIVRIAKDAPPFNGASTDVNENATREQS